MSLLFEYKPGMDLTQPWPFTVTRSQPGFRIDKSGALVQAPANVLRDNHYVSGVRTALFEPPTLNRCLQSQALATTPWGTAFMLSVTNNAGAAPDGTVTATLAVPSAISTNQHALTQSLAVTANENLAVSIFVKASGYTALQLQFDDNGPQTNRFRVNFDLVTGTVGTTHDAAGTGGLNNGWFIVPLANGWFWIGMWGVLGNGLTTGRLIPFVYDTIANANAGTAYTGDAVSGMYFWGAQIERNGTTIPQAPTSYMPTAAVVSSTRSADAMNTPWPFKVMPMWCYSSWYDLGMCQRAQSAFTVTIVPAAPADPQWCGVFAGVSSDVRTTWISGAGAGGAGNTNRNTAATNASLNPVYGDFVETFSRVMSDGSTKLSVRKNGGAVFDAATVGPLGTVPFADFAQNPLLWLGFPGETIAPLIGLTGVRIGADPTRITTLAQAAAA